MFVFCVSLIYACVLTGHSMFEILIVVITQIVLQDWSTVANCFQRYLSPFIRLGLGQAK